MNITYNWIEIVNGNKFFIHNDWYQINYFEDTYKYNSKNIDNLSNKETKFMNQCIIDNNFNKKFIIECYITNFLHNNKKYILITKCRCISNNQSNTCGKIKFSGNITNKELESKYYQLWNTNHFEIFENNFIKLLEQYNIKHTYDKNDIAKIYHLCIPIKEIKFDKNVLFPFFCNKKLMLLEKESEFLVKNIEYLHSNEINELKLYKKYNPNILDFFTKLKYKIYSRKYKQNKLNIIPLPSSGNKNVTEIAKINSDPIVKKDIQNIMIYIALNKNIDQYLDKYRYVNQSPIYYPLKNKSLELQLDQNKYEDILFNIFYQRHTMNKTDEMIYLNNYQVNNQHSKQILKKMLKDYIFYDTYDNFIYEYLVPVLKYKQKENINKNCYNRDRIKDKDYWFRCKLIFNLTSNI